MKKKIIVVTGTPATGKTTVSKKIADSLNASYIDVNEVVSKYKLGEGFDKKRQSIIVDVKKLSKKLESIVKNSRKSVVIDSHLSHYLSSKFVDLCIVVRCDLKALKKRMEDRGYAKDKVRENLDSEIFDICLMEAMALGHTVAVIDTTKKWRLSKKLFKV